MKKLLTIVLFIFLTTTIYAENQTIELSVPSMTCKMCSITLERVFKPVSGITSFKADNDEKTITVSYDDNILNLDDIIMMTINAGYPAIASEKNNE